MAGLPKYFVDTPYQVIDGNIAYASNLNNPFAAIATGIMALSADIQQGTSKYATDTGGANAYVVSLSPAPSSYSEGLEVWLKASATCTGPSTINVNSLGAIEIRRHGLEELSAGDISANYFTHLKYSNGYFQIVSASGRGEVAADEAEASAATATANAATTASDVLLTNQARIDCNDILNSCSGYSNSASNSADVAEGLAVIANARAVTATEQAAIATAAATSLTGAIEDISALETLVGGGVLGVGQTWQNVLATRAKSVTYTNSTGKPILVSITVAGVGALVPRLYISGIQATMCTMRSNNVFEMAASVMAIVPPLGTYRFTEDIGAPIILWAELR